MATSWASLGTTSAGIKSDCTQNGMSYSTVVRADGSRFSACCPTGAPGELAAGKCSIYIDGVLSALQGPTNPHPVLPGRVATLPNANQARLA